MIIKQFNQTSPQTLEANRTQVNINVVPAIRTTVDGEMSGYEYDTVVIENAYMYSDEALVEIAKLQYAKQYLIDTDYVAVKYNDEVTVTGSTTKTAFLAKYSDVYANRAAARLIVAGA